MKLQSHFKAFLKELMSQVQDSQAHPTQRLLKKRTRFFCKVIFKIACSPGWLLGSIPSNTHIVTYHGERGRGVTVPLVLLVADSEMAFTLLQMYEGPEKHITIATEMEVISVTLRFSAQERIEEDCRKEKVTLH